MRVQRQQQRQQALIAQAEGAATTTSRPWTPRRCPSCCCWARRCCGAGALDFHNTYTLLLSLGRCFTHRCFYLHKPSVPPRPLLFISIARMRPPCTAMQLRAQPALCLHSALAPRPSGGNGHQRHAAGEVRAWLCRCGSWVASGVAAVSRQAAWLACVDSWCLFAGPGDCIWRHRPQSGLRVCSVHRRPRCCCW